MIIVQPYRDECTVFLELFSDGIRRKLSRIRREIVYRDGSRVKKRSACTYTCKKK